MRPLGRELRDISGRYGSSSWSYWFNAVGTKFVGSSCKERTDI